MHSRQDFVQTAIRMLKFRIAIRKDVGDRLNSMPAYQPSNPTQVTDFFGSDGATWRMAMLRDRIRLAGRLEIRVNRDLIG